MNKSPQEMTLTELKALAFDLHNDLQFILQLIKTKLTPLVEEEEKHE